MGLLMDSGHVGGPAVTQFLFDHMVCSLAEVGQREQPPLPPSDPTTVSGLHGHRPHLRSCGEPLPGDHRSIQGAQSLQAAGRVEQPE